MILRLTTWDRVIITSVIGSLKGDVALMRKASKILDAVEFTPEERSRVGLRLDGSILVWDETGEVFEREIDDEDALDLLKKSLRDFQGWQGVDHKRVLRLFDLIGV